MPASDYTSNTGYDEKVPVTESGSASPSSPKSRFSTSGSFFTAAGRAGALFHHPKSTKRTTVSEECNASSSPEEEKLDEGWPLLARLMEKNPDFEAFARFRELNVKNLLYYQVELEFLSNMLRRQELRDDRTVEAYSDGKFSKFPLNMMQQYEDEDGDCMQWEYVLRIRRCLREYNEAMLQYARVSALPEANSREMETLTNWIVNPQGGNYTISSWGAGVWGKLYEWDEEKRGIRHLLHRLWKGLKNVVLFKSTAHTRSDLVVPRPGVKADAVATWITYTLVPWLFELGYALRGKKKRVELYRGPRDVSLPVLSLAKLTPVLHRLTTFHLTQANISRLSVVPISKATSLVATAIACALPTAAIAVLTTALAVTHQQKLLWIGGFTILFAIGIVAFTNEISKAHVFMAAATSVSPSSFDLLECKLIVYIRRLAFPLLWLSSSRIRTQHVVTRRYQSTGLVIQFE
jgi:hypothetical protein